MVQKTGKALPDTVPPAMGAVPWNAFVPFGAGSGIIAGRARHGRFAAGLIIERAASIDMEQVPCQFRRLGKPPGPAIGARSVCL